MRHIPAGRPDTTRFAALAAMTPAERASALASPDAANWIESAAVFGLVEAQVLLGQLHLEGRARMAGPGVAFRWFSAAASAGHAPAINMVGRCLEHGWDVPPDPVTAASCYRRAAQAGLDWAQFNYAHALLLGRGVAADRHSSYAWFAKAAAQGHAKAMNMLGRFHEEGWVGQASRVEAATWYRRAAEGGDFRGQFNYASLLQQRGRSGEAWPWFAAAIAQGSPDFLAEAARLLSASDDPALQALAPDAMRVSGIANDYHKRYHLAAIHSGAGECTSVSATP